jgi:hypothetical protein
MDLYGTSEYFDKQDVLSESESKLIFLGRHSPMAGRGSVGSLPVESNAVRHNPNVFQPSTSANTHTSVSGKEMAANRPSMMISQTARDHLCATGETIAKQVGKTLFFSPFFSIGNHKYYIPCIQTLTTTCIRDITGSMMQVIGMSGMDDVQEHAKRFARNSQWLQEALDTRNVVDPDDLRAALDWEVKARDAQLKRTMEVEDASQASKPLSYAGGMCWTSGAITPNIKQMLANIGLITDQQLHASADSDQEILPESTTDLHKLCKGLLEADTKIVESMKSAPKPQHNKRKLPTSAHTELAEAGRWRKIGSDRPDIMAEARAWMTAGATAGKRVLSLQHAVPPPSNDTSNYKTGYTAAMPSNQQAAAPLKKPKAASNRPKPISQVTPIQDLRRAQMLNPQGTMMPTGMVHSPGNMQDKQGLFPSVMSMSPNIQLSIHAAMHDSTHMQSFQGQGVAQIKAPQQQLTHTPQQQLTHTPQQQLTHTPQQQHTHTPQQQLTHTPQQVRTMQPNVQASQGSQPTYAQSGSYNPQNGPFNAPIGIFNAQNGPFNAASGNYHPQNGPFNAQSGIFKPASSDSPITYQNTPGGYKCG